MLGKYYYHQIIRKSILTFGSCFNNITIKRKKEAGVDGDPTAIETIRVPIQYGPSQKYIQRIASTPESLRKPYQITLPRISFEVKTAGYDSTRKVPPTQIIKTPSESGNKQYSQYMPVPYNLYVELSIIAKNQDDGLQILEQILPYFHPSLTFSVELIEETHEERDIAIVLNGDVTWEDDYEDDFSTRRTITWKIPFLIKTYMFGPVDVQKDIRKININYGTDIKKRTAELRYSAEVESTEVPPVPRDEIDPSSNDYKIVESFEDIYSEDNSYFGLDL
mgnify:CR=1 FL=1